MRVIEFRIPFPSTVEEVCGSPLQHVVLYPNLNFVLWQYRLGQIYMVAKVCAEMTDPTDGAGVESIANEVMSEAPQPISQFPTYSPELCGSKCIYTEKFVIKPN